MTSPAVQPADQPADHLELVDWRQRTGAAFGLARDAAAAGDPAGGHYRFSVPVRAAPEEVRSVAVREDGTLELRRIRVVDLPDPVGASLDVWSLAQYGGGRYLLPTTKGAWLGRHRDEVVLDLNFAYHPSCRDDPRWECPLAPEGNTVTTRVEAGERLP